MGSRQLALISIERTMIATISIFCVFKNSIRTDLEVGMSMADASQANASVRELSSLGTRKTQSYRNVA